MRNRICRAGTWLLLLMLLGARPLPGVAQTEPPPRVFLPLVMRGAPGAQWIGPDGGLIASVAFYPADASIVYAGSWGGGVYKSTDGGWTWRWKSQGLANLTVVSMAVDPGNPDVAYAGTYRGKVFKTIDGGESWFLSSQGIQEGAIVYSTVIDPGNPQRVHIATRGYSNNGGPPWNGVIYRSDDGGASWVRKLYNVAGSSQQDWAYWLQIHPKLANTILAATHEYGIYISENAGDSWRRISNGITNLSTRAVVAGPTTEYQNWLYTGVWERRGVYRSTNLGDSWSLRSNGIDGAHIYSMDIDHELPRWVYAATYNMGVMRTTDAASSWSNVGLAWDPIATVRIHPLDSTIVFAGTAGDGLFASRDRGSTWGRSQAGMQASSTTALIVSPDDPQDYYASIDGSGVVRSEDGGVSWSDFSQNLSSLLVNSMVQQPQGTALFALTDGGGLYYCDLRNSGACWQRVGSNLPTAVDASDIEPSGRPFASRNTFLEAYGVPGDGLTMPQAVPGNNGLQVMAFAPSNTQMAYLGTDSSGVYKSTNGGMNWATAGLSGKKVWALAVDPTNPQVVYAATDQSGEVKVSTNAGSSWSNISLAGVTVYSLAISPAAPDVLWAGGSNGVYRRAGGSWSPSGLAGSEVAWLAFHPSRVGVLWAGTSNGSFLSEDGGSSWNPGPAELAGHVVQSIHFDPFDASAVYFCTTAHGVLRAYYP